MTPSSFSLLNQPKPAGVSVVQNRSGEDEAITFTFNLENLPAKQVLNALMVAGKELNNKFGKSSYGSTACITLAERTENIIKIYNAAAGDSLAFLLLYNNKGELVGKPLLINRAIHSLDPEINPKEHKRISSHAKGKVLQVNLGAYKEKGVIKEVICYRQGNRRNPHYHGIAMSRSFGDFSENQLGNLNTPETNFITAKIPPGGRALIISLSDAFAPFGRPDYVQWITDVVTPIWNNPCPEIAKTLTTRVSEGIPKEWADDDASAVVMEEGGGAVFDGHGKSNKNKTDENGFKENYNDVSKNLATHCQSYIDFYLQNHAASFNSSQTRDFQILEDSLIFQYEMLLHEVQHGTFDGVKKIINSIKTTLSPDTKSEPSEEKIPLKGIMKGMFSSKTLVAFVNDNDSKEKDFRQFQKQYLPQKLPLHFAAERGDEEIVRCLLEHGADPTLVDDLGFTPMHYAAKEGQLSVILFLLNFQNTETSYKADAFLFFLNPKFFLNSRIIETYVQEVAPGLNRTQTELIKDYLNFNPFEYLLLIFLEKNPNLLWEKIQSEHVLLAYAIMNSSTSLIEVILQKMYDDRQAGKAPANFDEIIDKNFCVAAQQNKIEVVKLFIKNGFIFKDFTFLMDHGSGNVSRLMRDYMLNLPVNPELAKIAGKSILQNRSHEDAATVFKIDPDILDNLPSRHTLQALMDAGTILNNTFGRDEYGSTACITLIKRKGNIVKIFNLSVGDSFSVRLTYGPDGKLIGDPQLINRQLHTLTNPEEYNWIEQNFGAPRGDRLPRSGLNMSRAFGDFDATREGLRNTPETNFLMTKIPAGGEVVVINVTDAFDSNNLRWIADIVTPILSKTPQEIADTLTKEVTWKNHRIDPGHADDASATVMVFRHEEKSQPTIVLAPGTQEEKSQSIIEVGSGTFDGHGITFKFNDVSTNLAMHSPEHITKSLKKQVVSFNELPNKEAEILEDNLIELYETLLWEVQVGTLASIEAVIRLITQALFPDSKPEKPVELKAELKDVLNGKFTFHQINNPEDKTPRKLPIHYAAAAGNNEMLNCLLLHGTDPYLTDHLNKNAIDHAIENNKLASVKLLMEVKDEKPVIENPKKNSWPFIALAAQFGHIEIVKYFLSLGAMFSSLDFQVFDPFLQKILEPDRLKEIVLLLLKSKPDLLWEEPSPLQFTLNYTAIPLAEVLIDHAFELMDKNLYLEKLTPVLYRSLGTAIDKQRMNIINIFLQRGITPKDLENITVLNSEEMIKNIALALSFKDLNKFLLGAIKQKNIKFVRILLGIGTSTSYKDSEGNTALYYAKKSKMAYLITFITGHEKNRISIRNSLKVNDKNIAAKLQILVVNKSKTKLAVSAFLTKPADDKETKDDKTTIFDFNPFIRWFDHLIHELTNNPDGKKLNLKINLLVECVNNLIHEKWFEVNVILTRCHKHFKAFSWSEKIYNTPRPLLIKKHLEFQEYLAKHSQLKWFEEVTGCIFEPVSAQATEPSQPGNDQKDSGLSKLSNRP